MLKVKGTKIAFRRSDKGLEYTDDDGETWYFTFRTEREVRDMWGNRLIGELPHDEDEQDAQLEIYGATLDEPIPEDFFGYLNLTPTS